MLTIVEVFFVPKHRNGDPAAEARVGRGVELMQELDVEHRVRNHALRFVKRPPLASHEVVHDRQSDHVFEPFELSENQGSMRPWARVRDVEMIPSGLGLEGLAARRVLAVSGDPVSKSRVRAHELPARALGVVPKVMPNAVD